MHAKALKNTMILATTFSTASIYAAPISVPFSEDFESFAFGTTPLTVAATPNAIGSLVANPFDAASTSLQIAMEDAPAAAYLLYGEATALQDFTVSVTIQAQDAGQDIDFGDGEYGITAAGAINAGSSPTDLAGNPFLAYTSDSGYKLFVDTGFNDNTQTLVLRNGATNIATADVSDLTDFFDQLGFTLTLTGTYQPNGDVELVGTLTDLLTDAPGNDDSASVTVTVLAADRQLGDEFGLFQFHSDTGNDAIAAYDNLLIDVVPEPGVALLGLAGLGLITSRRRD
ncbi:MAG: hypothetical protein AAF916_05120 [Planctomycetota bacterium]